MPCWLPSKSCFYYPNLQLKIKRFITWLRANGITTTWGGVPHGTLSMMFSCCPNLMFLASSWLDFQISHFAVFEQFKVDVHFANFRKVKTDPIHSLLLTLDRSQLFYCVWVRHAAKNNPNPLCNMFFWFLRQEKTKSFTELRKYLLNGSFFLTVWPRAVFRTQSKVYGGDLFAKIVNYI